MEVCDKYGCVLVREQRNGVERRWWFSPTNMDRLVFIEMAVDREDDTRVCREEYEADMPERVGEALSPRTVLDTDGKILHT